MPRGGAERGAMGRLHGCWAAWARIRGNRPCARLNWPVRKPRARSFEGGAAPASGPEEVSTGRAGADAREIVHRRLAAQARRFPDLTLGTLEVTGLAPRDAALAHALYDAVIRRWLTLRALLETRLRSPLGELEPKLQGVLLAGAAQLFLLDRIPPHAAINESVAWAKRAIRPGAGAMVNAVLRRLADLRAGATRLDVSSGSRREFPLAAGRALELSEDFLPEDPVARLAAGTSHDPAIVGRWWQSFGPHAARSLAMHGLIEPPTILHTRFASGPIPGGLLTGHSSPGHHVFTGEHSALIALLESRTDLWVQDPASSEAVWSVRHLSPSIILDVCAGQGTKTRQLAAQFPRASVVATDIDAGRLHVLRGALARAANVTVVEPAMVRDWAGRADLVVLDVPCSNSGVLARRPEARYRGDAATLERLAATQRQIIADSIPLLAPRGAILYSTCSLEESENAAQAAWARRWHSFRMDLERATLPGGVPGDDPRAYTDGSFSCVLHGRG